MSHPGRADLVRIGPERSVMIPKAVFGMRMVLRSLKVNSHRLYA